MSPSAKNAAMLDHRPTMRIFVLVIGSILSLGTGYTRSSSFLRVARARSATDRMLDPPAAGLGSQVHPLAAVLAPLLALPTLWEPRPSSAAALECAVAQLHPG